jgi:hypothetical protein
VLKLEPDPSERKEKTNNKSVNVAGIEENSMFAEVEPSSVC